MPGLAPSVLNQARTTGINMTVWMGRSSTALIEVDAKTCNIAKSNAEQDKTGSMGLGWGDAEQGNKRWNLSMELIFHIDTPLDLSGDAVWYIRREIAGYRTDEAYFLINSIADDAASAADHTITLSGISVNRKEGEVWFRPTSIEWEAEATP